MKVVTAFVFTTVAVCAASAGHAQSAATTPPQADERQQGLEDIIVTAQRRSENLQNVPIAVTALTSEAVAQSGAAGIDSLSKAVPGLNITSSQRSIQAFIRGVGSSNTSTGAEAAVSLYVDGVYQSAAAASLFSFNNIERIEVLKGPQGTLYGRNATGGLIHVYTRDPSETPALMASLNYSNYQTIDGALYATAGVTSNLSANFSYYGINQADGYGRNLVTGSEVNRRKEFGVRSKIKWEPSADDTIILGANYGRTKTDIGTARSGFPGSFQTGGFPRVGGDYDITWDQDPVADVKYYGVDLTYKRHLGHADLRFLSAYTNVKSDAGADNDATARPFLRFQLNDRVSSYQNEVTLTGDVGRFAYTLGAFYFHSTASYEPLTFASALIPTQNLIRLPVLALDSYSAYSQGTYKVTDTTNITLGLRYTSDRRDFATRDVATAGNPVAAGTVLSSGQGKKTFSKLTYRAAIDQKLGSDVLVYASYNRGFKSGTYNSAAVFGPPVNPEILDAYEVGLKSEFLNHSLRINAAAYHYDYSGLQLTQNLTGTPLLLNAASARINGADLEATFAPRLSSGNLELRAAVAYTDGKFTNFPGGPLNTPRPAATGGNATTFVNLAGRTLTRTPKWTVSTSASYSVPLGSGSAGANASYFHNSGFFIEPDNRLRQNAYDVVNAEIYYAFGEDGRYRIRIFGRNLGNERYLLAGAEGSLGDVIAYQDPRTYGIGFAVKFGGN